MIALRTQSTQTMTSLLAGVAARVAAGRRHRHHEHHARVGDRAHAGDRAAHGDRRARVRRAAAVSGRGGRSSAWSADRSASRWASACRTSSSGISSGRRSSRPIRSSRHSDSRAWSACSSASTPRARRRRWIRSRHSGSSRDGQRAKGKGQRAKGKEHGRAPEPQSRSCSQLRALHRSPRETISGRHPEGLALRRSAQIRSLHARWRFMLPVVCRRRVAAGTRRRVSASSDRELSVRPALFGLLAFFIFPDPSRNERVLQAAGSSGYRVALQPARGSSSGPLSCHGQ